MMLVYFRWRERGDVRESGDESEGEREGGRERGRDSSISEKGCLPVYGLR